MEFNWTKKQIELKKEVIEFASKKLNENIIEQDNLGEFPRQKWLDCASFRIQGAIIPEEYNGINLDISSAVLLMEGLGYGCKDNGLLFSINAHIWGCEIPILHFGTDEQKNKYLPGFVCRQIIRTHALIF